MARSKEKGGGFFFLFLQGEGVSNYKQDNLMTLLHPFPCYSVTLSWQDMYSSLCLFFVSLFFWEWILLVSCYNDKQIEMDCAMRICQCVVIVGLCCAHL